MAWRCKTCGVLEPKEVTYFEKCDYCGEDVEDVDIVEECVCCDGTGLCEEIDGEQSSCMICLGSGKIKY